MGVLMEALGYQNYGGKWYVRGEQILVDNDGDAADMVALHLAKRVPKPKQPPKEDRSMTAETEDSAMAEVDTAKDTKKDTVPAPKRGQYLHRAARNR